MACITNLVIGGVGNQMFEIATGYSLAKELGFKYVLCDANFVPIGGQGNNLPYYKDNLYKKFTFCQSVENFMPYMAKKYSYYPLLTDLSGAQTSICLLGYYQSEQNFIKHRDEIRALFTPDEGYSNWLLETGFEYTELLEDHDYVFIGVRRGDYLKSPTIHNPCGMVYYQKAMKLLPATRYYIATDDIEWCRRNFIGEQYVFFDISMKNDIVQLAAMTLFKKYIISNSSFYWWGSYLSMYKDPVVVAPDKWVSPPHDRNVWTRDFIYRADMIIVERPIETV